MNNVKYIGRDVHKSYNQAVQVPSYVACKLPRSPFRKSRMVLASASIVHSISSFPTEPELARREGRRPIGSDPR